jgi:hypothetical protein
VRTQRLWVWLTKPCQNALPCQKRGQPMYSRIHDGRRKLCRRGTHTRSLLLVVVTLGMMSPLKYHTLQRLKALRECNPSFDQEEERKRDKEKATTHKMALLTQHDLGSVELHTCAHADGGCEDRPGMLPLLIATGPPAVLTSTGTPVLVNRYMVPGGGGGRPEGTVMEAAGAGALASTGGAGAGAMTAPAGGGDPDASDASMADCGSAKRGWPSRRLAAAVSAEAGLGEKTARPCGAAGGARREGLPWGRAPPGMQRRGAGWPGAGARR